jgi:hypothetical protein
MAGVYVNDEGSWKLPKSIWINQLGTWRVCKNVYVKSGGAWKELIKTIDITSSKSNFNLYEYLGSPAEALSVVVNISGFVEIFSSNTSGNRTPALTVGNFPTGSTVIINNNGYISGGGGFGGKGTWYGYDSGSNGTKGGDGIVKGSSNSFDCTIVNTGTIAGGGGGGGGGRGFSVSANPVANPTPVAGNTGGQGAGITGASRTQGGQPTQRNGGSPNSQGGGGIGGSLGESGVSDQTSAGAGGKAIGSGIEIAVSGTIIGAIG